MKQQLPDFSNTNIKLPRIPLCASTQSPHLSSSQVALFTGRSLPLRVSLSSQLRPQPSPSLNSFSSLRTTLAALTLASGYGGDEWAVDEVEGFSLAWKADLVIVFRSSIVSLVAFIFSKEDGGWFLPFAVACVLRVAGLGLQDLWPAGVFMGLDHGLGWAAATNHRASFASSPYSPHHRALLSFSTTNRRAPLTINLRSALSAIASRASRYLKPPRSAQPPPPRVRFQMVLVGFEEDDWWWIGVVLV
ncbi:hypothetical protein Droror1_Dr00007649 [Drosera rotundifolia]